MASLVEVQQLFHQKSFKKIARISPNLPKLLEGYSYGNVPSPKSTIDNLQALQLQLIQTLQLQVLRYRINIFKVKFEQIDV